jgi:hypothetical protein
MVNRTSGNWGSGYTRFGQQRYPSGNLTRGTIFRGSAPAVNKFRAPDAGVTPNFSGPSGPIINQQSNGIINRTINTLAAGGVAMKDENIRARRQRRQQGIDQAKVQLKINNIRNQRAQAGQALVNAYQQATRPQPVNPYAQIVQAGQQQNAGNALVQQWQQGVAPQAPPNPLMQAWNNSPNNPRAPWNVKPPTGNPVTSLPPSPPQVPLSNTGVPALPPQRPAPQARQLNTNAPQMPAPFPPPMTPANTNPNTPAPPMAPPAPMPPPPPKTTRGAGKTGSPFDLPPLQGTGGDFITQSMRNMADNGTNTAPSSVEWKDEPTNPFPSGPLNFDRSRMFDPTYKPNEEITSSASSRTKKRPPK